MKIEYKSGGIAVLGDSSGGDGWTIQGLGSTYDLDLGGDRVRPGAYRDSLKNRPNVPMLWSHQSDEPIGKTTLLAETSQGLYFKAQLSDTRRGRDTRTLMADGALSGVSIGYNPTKTSYTTIAGERVRNLNEIDLFELSVVTFPMNESARASLGSVKSLRDALTIAEYETCNGGRVPPDLARKYARIERSRMLAEIDAAQKEIDAILMG